MNETPRVVKESLIFRLKSFLSQCVISFNRENELELFPVLKIVTNYDSLQHWERLR